MCKYPEGVLYREGKYKKGRGKGGGGWGGLSGKDQVSVGAGSAFGS